VSLRLVRKSCRIGLGTLQPDTDGLTSIPEEEGEIEMGVRHADWQRGDYAGQKNLAAALKEVGLDSTDSKGARRGKGRRPPRSGVSKKIWKQSKNLGVKGDRICSTKRRKCTKN